MKLATMNDMTNWKVPKWPFFLADALLFGFAYFFILRAPHVHSLLGNRRRVRCLRAVFECDSVLSDYRAMGKALEINALGAVAEKIQNLEKLSEQINSATSHWAIIQETVQAEAEKPPPPPNRSPTRWLRKPGSFPS